MRYTAPIIWHFSRFCFAALLALTSLLMFPKIPPYSSQKEGDSFFYIVGHRVGEAVLPLFYLLTRFSRIWIRSFKKVVWLLYFSALKSASKAPPFANLFAEGTKTNVACLLRLMCFFSYSDKNVQMHTCANCLLGAQ